MKQEKPPKIIYLLPVLFLLTFVLGIVQTAMLPTGEMAFTIALDAIGIAVLTVYLYIKDHTEQQH